MSFNKEFTANAMQNIADLDSLRDLTIYAGPDQQKFRVHRVVMAATSNYFKNSLQSPMSNEFNFKSTQGPIMKMIIDYCYSGNIDFNVDNIIAITTAAFMLKIDPLKQKCTQFCVMDLKPEQMVVLMLRTMRYNISTDISQKFVAIISKIFEKIPIGEILQLNGKNFHALLSHDQIKAPEIYIFDVMKKWIEQNETEREEFVPDLVNCIRLKHMSTEFIYETVEPFYKKYNCIDHVLNEYRMRIYENGPTSLHRYSPSLAKSIRVILSAVSDNSVDVKTYNFWTEVWETIRMIPIEIPMQECGLAILDNKLFVLGGRTTAGLLKSMWSCDLSTGIKECLPDMPHGRSNFTPIVVGNSIYVHGGKRGTDGFDTFARFDTMLGLWETLESCPVSLNKCSVVGNDGKIYVLGRYGQIGFDAYAFYCYDTDINAWTRKRLIRGENLEGAILAKRNQTVCAIVKKGLIHEYDFIGNSWKHIKYISSGRIFVRTIEYHGEMYVLFKARHRTGMFFGKIDLQERTVIELSALHDNLSYFLHQSYF